ncbi:MAG: T9SS type A sorting domain-containing protein, partial [Bacteroidota bacterium]
TMEFVSGAPGPIGHGSMFALDYVADTTWRVLWADSTLRNSPLWVNCGYLNGQFVVAGANTWDLSPLDTLYANLNVYGPQGFKVGVWRRDSIYIQQFHLLDIDHDGRTNLLFAQTSNSQGRYLKDFESDSLTSVDGGSDLLPDELQLLQNYPNPFNPETILGYALPKNSYVRLVIFNLLGQKISTLVDEVQPAGRYRVAWNASDRPSGIYFYRLETPSVSVTKKMLFTR